MAGTLLLQVAFSPKRVPGQIQIDTVQPALVITYFWVSRGIVHHGLGVRRKRCVR